MSSDSKSEPNVGAPVTKREGESVGEWTERPQVEWKAPASLTDIDQKAVNALLGGDEVALVLTRKKDGSLRTFRSGEVGVNSHDAAEIWELMKSLWEKIGDQCQGFSVRGSDGTIVALGLQGLDFHACLKPPPPH